MITSNVPLPSGSTQTTATSHNQFSSLSNQPLSRFQKFKRIPQHTQSDFTRYSSNAPYHTKQTSYQQSFPPQQSYTSNRDSTITAYYSLTPPSPSATTLSGVTDPPSTPAHQHPLSPAMQSYVTYLKNVYTSIDTPVYDKEHSLLQVKAKYFINIALVHKYSHQYMNDSDRNEMIMDRLHGHVDIYYSEKENKNFYL